MTRVKCSLVHSDVGWGRHQCHITARPSGFCYFHDPATAETRQLTYVTRARNAHRKAVAVALGVGVLWNKTNDRDLLVARMLVGLEFRKVSSDRSRSVFASHDAADREFAAQAERYDALVEARRRFYSDIDADAVADAS